jgi:hypothetical protein
MKKILFICTLLIGLTSTAQEGKLYNFLLSDVIKSLCDSKQSIIMNVCVLNDSLVFYTETMLTKGEVTASSYSFLDYYVYNEEERLYEFLIDDGEGKLCHILINIYEKDEGLAWVTTLTSTGGKKAPEEAEFLDNWVKELYPDYSFIQTSETYCKILLDE